MTRQEHLDWCKSRAMEYLAEGDMRNAWSSIVSDLREHPAIQVGIMLMMSGQLSIVSEMQKFIQDFN